VTAWWSFGARLILRETYSHFKLDPKDNVTIQFILGTPPSSDPGLRRFLHWEQQRFQDILQLNIQENMNSGKSYDYFAELGKTYPFEEPEERPWDYAMKADDDSLINLPQLVERLRPMVPRLDTYMVCLNRI
jgi:hypothetical protein